MKKQHQQQTPLPLFFFFSHLVKIRANLSRKTTRRLTGPEWMPEGSKIWRVPSTVYCLILSEGRALRRGGRRRG